MNFKNYLNLILTNGKENKKGKNYEYHLRSLFENYGEFESYVFNPASIDSFKVFKTLTFSPDFTKIKKMFEDIISYYDKWSYMEKETLDWDTITESDIYTIKLLMYIFSFSLSADIIANKELDQILDQINYKYFIRYNINDNPYDKYFKENLNLYDPNIASMLMLISSLIQKVDTYGIFRKDEFVNLFNIDRNMENQRDYIKTIEKSPYYTDEQRRTTIQNGKRVLKDYTDNYIKEVTEVIEDFKNFSVDEVIKKLEKGYASQISLNNNFFISLPITELGQFYLLISKWSGQYVTESEINIKNDLFDCFHELVIKSVNFYFDNIDILSGQLNRFLTTRLNYDKNKKGKINTYRAEYNKKAYHSVSFASSIVENNGKILAFKYIKSMILNDVKNNVDVIKKYKISKTTFSKLLVMGD